MARKSDTPNFRLCASSAARGRPIPFLELVDEKPQSLFGACLLRRHAWRGEAGKPQKAIRLFVDEFQEIVGRSLAALLAQSRKFGVSLFLANQSTSQLENRDLSLADQVFEGTAVKQYFTSLGNDVAVLQSLSKDKLKYLIGESGEAKRTSHPIIVPKLDRDTILDVTFKFGRSFVVVNDGEGHAHPRNRGPNLGVREFESQNA